MQPRGIAVIAGLVVAGIVIVIAAAAAAARQPVVPAAPPPAASPAAADRAAHKIRVGVYDPRAVAVAYSRGHGDDQRLKQLREELKQAEQAGKNDRAAQVRAQGERLQMLRHLQGFAGARVDDIMATLADRLPQIARDAGVVAIVDRLDYTSAEVETVDLTDRLAAEFKPDEKTLKILAEMRTKKPLPMLDVLAMKPTD